jgi:hypothetical protein
VSLIGCSWPVWLVALVILFCCLALVTTQAAGAAGFAGRLAVAGQHMLRRLETSEFASAAQLWAHWPLRLCTACWAGAQSLSVDMRELRACWSG